MAKAKTKKQIAEESLKAQGGSPQRMESAILYGPATFDPAIGYAPGCMDYGVLQLNRDYVIVRRDELDVLQEHYAPVPIADLVDNVIGLMGWLDWLDIRNQSKETRAWMESVDKSLEPYKAARQAKATAEHKR